MILEIPLRIHKSDLRFYIGESDRGKRGRQNAVDFFHTKPGLLVQFPLNALFQGFPFVDHSCTEIIDKSVDTHTKFPQKQHFSFVESHDGDAADPLSDGFRAWNLMAADNLIFLLTSGLIAVGQLIVFQIFSVLHFLHM